MACAPTLPWLMSLLYHEFMHVTLCCISFLSNKLGACYNHLPSICARSSGVTGRRLAFPILICHHGPGPTAHANWSLNVRTGRNVQNHTKATWSVIGDQTSPSHSTQHSVLRIHACFPLRRGNTQPNCFMEPCQGHLLAQAKAHRHQRTGVGIAVSSCRVGLLVT